MEISLTLDHGFRDDVAESIAALTPDGDFVIDHDTVIGYRLWSPAAESPYNYYVIVDMGVGFAKLLAAGLISAYAKDLYGWAKNQIVPFFKKKHENDDDACGDVKISFGDLTISAMIEKPEDLEGLFSNLSDLTKKMNPEVHKEWEIDLSEQGYSIGTLCPMCGEQVVVEESGSMSDDSTLSTARTRCSGCGWASDEWTVYEPEEP